MPALRKLARRDKAVCPGWWRVCDEAVDAIAVIEDRLPPGRRRSSGTAPSSWRRG